MLRRRGVDLRRVVLGHSGDTTDADHLCELADAGFLLGMDRFGINLDTTFEARADIVVEMCRRGYAEQMVLSQDAACYIDWVAPDVMALLPQWHYTHIHEDVLPYLREHGVTEEQIETMLVGNPRRYFENVGHVLTRLASRRRADRSRRDAGVRGSADRGISLVLVDKGDQASGWGRPASTTHERAAATEFAGGPVSGRALRLTMRASRTSSPTRTAPMTRSVESMCRT